MPMGTFITLTGTPDYHFAGAGKMVEAAKGRGRDVGLILGWVRHEKP